MNTLHTCLSSLLLATMACAAHAERVASAILQTPALPWQSPSLFVGWIDPLTSEGDLRAHRDSAAAPAHWSAADALHARQQARHASPRAFLTAGLARHSADWAALASRVAPMPFGGIRNANLWHVPAQAGRAGSEAMVYAGTVNGLLHGIAVTDGAERLAYLPRGQHTRAPRDPVGVDGPVWSGEAPIGLGGTPHTLLAFGLGSNGKGFVVLDVNSPTHLAQADPAQVVLLDRSTDTDADLGELHGGPVLDDADPRRAMHIVRIDNGRWALVVGNGFFSTAGRPALLVQYLDQARELVRLSPCEPNIPCAVAGANGLAMPRLLDTDGDGRIDLAYAGDLQGHVWRFSLRGMPTAWRAEHVLSTCDAQGQRQPITTAPLVRPHPRGGRMVIIGTGRHLRDTESALHTPQSLYGLHDQGQVDPLQPQAAGCQRPDHLTELRYHASGGLDPVGHYTIDEVTRPAPAAPARGWWVDLPHPGQRVLQHPQIFEGQQLLVHSVVPSGAQGLPRTTGRAYVSVLNLLTGLASPLALSGASELAAARTPWAMVAAPDGPSSLVRQHEKAALRFASGTELPLHRTRPLGARVGWHESP
jgi:Tfp pilus tip-associated adhesin PilY1